jgi:hypothetical protein
MPREAGRNPSFSDPSILLPKHRDVPFPLGPRRVPSAGPFPSQPPRGRLGAGAADQAENLVQHISGKGWQNRSPASPTGHIPSLEAFPKEYLRIPLHRDAVLRSGHHGPLESAAVASGKRQITVIRLSLAGPVTSNVFFILPAANAPHRLRCPFLRPALANLPLQKTTHRSTDTLTKTLKEPAFASEPAFLP